MEIVLYTQRVEIVESYGERRDCADQNIPVFLQACGFLPVPVPNIWDIAEKIAGELNPVGIVLTGGNSLIQYGGNAPERDEMEKNLLSFAIKNQIPVYGFCRGMQVILDYFGCKLEKIRGHVAVYHKIYGQYGESTVNSFHNQACFHVKAPVEVLATASDGVIEAIQIKEKNIAATMWHPERETVFRNKDIRWIQDLFRKEVK